MLLYTILSIFLSHTRCISHLIHFDLHIKHSSLITCTLRIARVVNCCFASACFDGNACNIDIISTIIVY